MPESSWGNDHVTSTVRRGALVGYGVIGEGHADGYDRQRKLEIVAIVDTCEARLRAGLRRFNGARAYHSVEEAIEAEQLDFIDVCTPPFLHARHISAGLAYGLFVICEKPLLLTTSEAAGVVASLEGSDGTLYPAHNYGFAPAVGRLLGVAHAELGELQRARFSTQRTGHARGTMDWMPDWRRVPTVSGGGILQDHGPHSVYLACRAMGRKPTAVQCQLGRSIGGAYEDTEDEAEILLEFGSVPVEVQLSWRSDRRTTRYELVGAAGTVALDGDRLETVSMKSSKREIIPSDFDDPRHGRWFAALLGDAHSFMASGQRPNLLVDEALVTIEVIEAAYRSAAEGGRRIPLEH